MDAAASTTRQRVWITTAEACAALGMSRETLRLRCSSLADLPAACAPFLQEGFAAQQALRRGVVLISQAPQAGHDLLGVAVTVGPKGKPPQLP